jgi:type IV pili sensor histidine kinase/response regulator
MLAAAALSAGCNATAPTIEAPLQEPAAAYAERARWDPAPDFIPVMRQGRYTLVELAPSSAQRDLLRQLVQTEIPASRNATVGDALRQVLGRSGYRLCNSADLIALQSLPLPASHHRMGPMMLRDALLTLAGPRWDLSVDDNTRQICFTRLAPLVTTPVNLNQAVEAGAVRPSPAVVRKPLP